MRNAVVNHSAFVDKYGYNIVCGQRGRNVTEALEISPTNGLVFHSAFLGGTTGQRFSDFLVQAKLDPNEHVIFIYNGAPAYNKSCYSWSQFWAKKPPPYSRYNIMEKTIKALKSARKADSSRPEQ